MTLAERFWAKVQKGAPDECWHWTGAKRRGGYGAFWVDSNRRAAIAHRVAYQLLVGPIPEGLTLDHLCRVTSCVNPAHLDPCTAGENARRSPNAPYNVRARQTHCKRGHEFSPANTRIHHGRRECRACEQARGRLRVAALRTCPAAADFKRPKASEAARSGPGTVQ